MSRGGPLPRHRLSGVLSGVALAIVLAGCGGSPPSAAPKSTFSTSTSVSAPTSTSTVPATTTTQPAPTTTAPTPVLGRLAGDFAHGEGFGQVKPSLVSNGGDPTGIVSGITWSSWGGAMATGTGTSDYVGPNQSVADGTEESATIVAFDVGTCDGTYMYQAVEWYFPEDGQSFDPGQYEDICTGTYVPAS